MQFRITAPIFVARQLAKHQVGASWNEVSRRYVATKPALYIPMYWRKAAENKKQGSSSEIHEESRHWAEKIKKHLDVSVELYNDMIVDGVCPEQARMVLPQSMMTTWIWTGSLYFFYRVYKERMHPNAQMECAAIARVIGEKCGDSFPEAWEALLNAEEK
jgi:thymidylate synthase (FAD)